MRETRGRLFNRTEGVDLRIEKKEGQDPDSQPQIEGPAGNADGSEEKRLHGV